MKPRQKHVHQQEKSINMELKFLLKDEVFVDFFNTFLSLPVFGQTPLYMINGNKWLMWPNVPFAQVNSGAFLQWLETHRMVFFKQTELYHSFILCKEILDFVSSRSTVDLKWTPADQWLLRKCLGSVRGIQRFRSFLKGSAEEELILFCVRVSVLLSLNKEKNEDAFQTLNHQALQTAIRQYDMTELLSKERPLISQTSVLTEMRMKALDRLGSYWLPQFLHCCKTWLWRVPECRPIVEKYTSYSCPSVQSPSVCEQEQSKSNPTVNPAKSYSSKRRKRHLWSSHKPSADRLQSKSICLWLPPASQEGLQCSNVAHPPQELHRNAKPRSDPTCIQPLENMNTSVHHTCVQTPACQIPCRVSVQSPASDVHCYLQSALSAEGLSGGPFRSYLKAQDLPEKQTMLDLLEDLDFFLLLVLKAQGEDPVCAERQSAARRITETYFTENMPRFIRLDPDTSHHLRSLLPSGAAATWIYTAKYEICKELQDAYDSFLDAEDEALVSRLSSCSEEFEDSAPLLFSSFETETEALITQTEAMLLCEGCCSRLDPDALSQDSWTLVALQNPRRGGSLLHKFKTADESKEPKLTTQSDATPVAEFPVSKVTGPEVHMKAPKKDSIIYDKPSSKPRSFAELITAQYIHHFKQFLQARGADGALLFIQDAEALRNVEPKRQKAKIRSIVDKYFRRVDPVHYLQCSADIISSVTQMDAVPPEVIYTVQHLVTKSLEATWFKQYQETFFSCSPVSSESSVRGPLLKDRLKTNAWEVFSRFVRCVRKFLSALEDREIRAEFEDYLMHDCEHFSTPYLVRPKAQQTSDSSCDGEKFKPKIRSVMNKTLIVDFLANDLSFYMECERFRHLADAGNTMASVGMYSETDYAMLHHKAELIISIFLHSDLSPRLMINISEAQKEAVLQRFASGKVDRTLFYQAMMDVFPVLIFCWKKFCCLRVMKHLYPNKALQNQAVSSRPEIKYPLIIQKEIKTVRTNEVRESTFRFSTQYGLVLLLPQTHGHTGASSAR